MTELLPATPENIALAARVLRDGGLVAFPTETVYGLGANALNADAVARIFSAKERPATDPLIIHLSGLEQITRVVSFIPPTAETLAKTFWPGPLTLVLPKQPEVPDSVTSGLHTAAVRVPDHPVALALIRAADCPIAAPSANRFGHTSPTTARHVWDDLQGRVDIILDGGETTVGVESTVLDVSTNPPRILRPGGITREMLEAVIGSVAVLRQPRTAEERLLSPGLLKKHYAPHTEMLLFIGENAREMLLTEVRNAHAEGKRVGALAMEEDMEVLRNAGAVVYALGADIASVARHLYAGMRWLDNQNLDLIVCRSSGEGGLGLAILDRLTRAATRVIT